MYVSVYTCQIVTLLSHVSAHTSMSKKYYIYATYNFSMCANFTKCEILV